MPMPDDDTVPCKLCRKPTRMQATRLCDPCYEMTRHEPTMRLVGAAQRLVEGVIPQKKETIFQILRSVRAVDLDDLKGALEPFEEKS